MWSLLHRSKNGDKKKNKIKGGERHFAPLWW
uniref:Uncharacterized protein n=1 Tax=virus sp. ctJpG3 TaxID=2825812 RepID=A0A8S5RMN0_9VIRU|nr:MAG TPA: hypothetical protein [virus sp. ctJpG3]